MTHAFISDMSTAYIGIGSNIGDRESNVLRAVKMMEAEGIRPVRLSSLIETEPWGVTDQPPYINAAAEVETRLQPMELLLALRDIQKRMGRFFDATRWGPRVIDLDILFYDDLTIKESGLSIPHPLIAERAFVLDPLNEIAPDLVHPQTGKTVAKMRDELRAADRPDSNIP